MLSKEESQEEHLVSSVRSLLQRCYSVLEELRQWTLEGVHKLIKTLVAEICFLERLLDTPDRIRKRHLKTTNFIHIEAVYEAIKKVGSIEEVLRVVAVPSKDATWRSRAEMVQHQSIKVDVVAERGLVWVKVFAQNAKALRYEMAGLEHCLDDGGNEDSDEDSDDEVPAGYGMEQLAIFKKAHDFLSSAEAHHVHFKRPVVVFAFMRVCAEEDLFVSQMLNKLRDMGITVYTQDSGDSISSTCRHLVHTTDDITTDSLHLDVSTVLALLSNMSHHPCPPECVEGEPLQVQAKREAFQPVLPQLSRILHEKRLFMVFSAYTRLKSIVEIVGGPLEQARFAYLFRNHHQHTPPFDATLWTCLPSLTVAVVSDAPSEAFRCLLEPPTRRCKLNNGRKIRTQFSAFHADIFGSGYSYQSTTVTSIQWMATALSEAGITGKFILCHEPRSLAEQKML
ncbi:hypothetical protein BDF14DRAFT_1792897 [Spinellus fusiger]|nr:hypothetical protein BDF14DRAFT_1792897 [Spinellus fusiger]